MITAASVSARRRASSLTGSVPGSTDNTSSPVASGVPIAAEAALTDVTPGTITALKRSANRVCMCM